MNRLHWVVSILLAALTGPAAHAGPSFGLGAHLGGSLLTSDARGSGSSSALTWPNNPFLYQPGIRLEVADEGHRNEAFFDSGLFLIDEAGSTLSLFAGALGYQHAFFGRTSPWAPFVNADVAFQREGGAARATTSTGFGGGVGLRRVVQEDHGALRMEARVDYLGDDPDRGRPVLITYGIRLGFDLWL